MISGGARGVTYRIARALAPFKPRVVLLGRTELDPAAAYGTLRNAGGPAEKRSNGFSKRKSPDRRATEAEEKRQSTWQAWISPATCPGFPLWDSRSHTIAVMSRTPTR